MQQPLGEPGSAETPARVLVVEDEVLIRLMIADELTLAGFKVTECASADEAWTVLQTSITVDLIVTDIRMPGRMDGAELARRVRSNWPHIKIVIASGETIKRTLGDVFLGKPFDPRDLADHVTQLLASRNDQT